MEGAGFALAKTLPEDRKAKGDQRLVLLRRDLEAVLDVFGDLGDPVTSACCESLPTHAKSAGLTGKAVGVAKMVLAERGIPYIEVPPASLKLLFAGSGRADKAAMKQAVPSKCEFTLANDNEVDAYALLQVLRQALGMNASLAKPEGLGKLNLEPIQHLLE